MNDTILAHAVDLQLYQLMALVTLWAVSLMAVFLVMVEKGPAVIHAAGPALLAAGQWCAKTFSLAGDRS